jgi:predicted dehydrogenase
MKWGILGCGCISNDFVISLKSIQQAKAIACASRSKKSSVEFGKKHGKNIVFICLERLTTDILLPVVEPHVY